MSPITELLLIYLLAVVIGAVLILFLLLIRDNRIRAIIFYLTGVYGVLLATLNCVRYSASNLATQAVALLFGVLAVGGLYTGILLPNYKKIANTLVSVSVSLGLVYLYFF